MWRFGIFLLIAAVCCGAQASDYWPLGNSAVDEKPKRISELIEPASRLIEEASDLASEGKTDKAVEKYRKALEELNRIEMENPERAKRTEFSTLRNKRAYVNAAIDSLLLSQVQSNAKAVAVSDTTELERRLDRERWGKLVDGAGVHLLRCRTDKALVDLEKAMAGTTNPVQLAATHIVFACAHCQKGDFDAACRDLAKTLQRLKRIGEQALSKEEMRLVSEFLQTLRSRIVDGHRESLEAGRRVCDVCADLETAEDLMTSNAVEQAGGVSESLGVLQDRLSVLAFPAARKLNRVSSNMQVRVSNVLRRMASGEKSEWDVDVADFASALKSFDALSPAIGRVAAVVSAVSQMVDEPKAEAQSRPSAKPLTKRDQALAAIAKGDYATGERIVGEMLVENPKGALALNLKAAMEARQGKFKESEATLDQAIQSNPRSHFAYYNMANLMLQVRKDDKSAAKRYYETGRAVGGPVDAQLEEALK